MTRRELRIVANAIQDLHGRTARPSTMARALADRFEEAVAAGELRSFDREWFIAECAKDSDARVRLQPNRPGRS